jgi:AcrR family transcriptional regulator
MSRWQAGARERLERAALELFVEQGFAETTVPQITARAGLTTRTFFRHFADKREVLFGGEGDIPERVGAFLAEAPTSMGPMDVVAHGLRTVMVPLFEGRLEALRTRKRVIEADEGLRERDLRKLAGLTELISGGLRERGTDELSATLAAELAMTAFRVALTRWLAQDGDGELGPLVEDTLLVLRSVATSESPS